MYNFPTPDEYHGDFSALLNQARPVAIYDPQTFSQSANGRWTGQTFPGNIIPASRISRVSKTIAAMAEACCLPTVRNADGSYPLIHNASQSAVNTPLFDMYNFTQKVDQVINDGNRLSGSFSYNSRPRYQLLGGGGNLWDPSQPLTGGPLFNERKQTVRSTLSRFAWDRNISPRLLNNVTLFHNRMSAGAYNFGVDRDGAQEWGIADIHSTGYPAVNWGGGPVYTLSNIGNTQNTFTANNGYGVTESVSFSTGRHFLKAGFDYRKTSTNTRPTGNPSFAFSALSTAVPNTASAGVTTGYSFASFLLGTVYSAGMSEPVGTGESHRYFAGFVQDDFKVTPTLTLNLGLRYEVQPPMQEMHNRLVAWDPAQPDPLSGLPGAYLFAGNCDVCTGNSYFGRIDWKDFGPRIGFAWRPLNKWTVRGAYGIFYSPDVQLDYTLPTPTFPWAGTYNLGAKPVTPWEGIFNWDNGFPTNAYVAPTFNRSYADTTGTAIMLDPSYDKIGYVQQWNLNVQRELPGGIVLEAGYVANKGTGLKAQALAQVNQLNPSVLAKYGTTLNSRVASAGDAAKYGIPYPYPEFNGTVASALRQYPQLRANSTVTDLNAPLGFSTYHSMQIVATKRLTKGLTFQANYVWSKALGNGVGSAGQAIAANSGPLDYYNLGLEKAPADFNQPSVFKGYVKYQLPVGRGRSVLPNAPKIVDALVGGWSMAWVVNYANGMPLGFSAPTPLATGWNGAVNRANVAAGSRSITH